MKRIIIVSILALVAVSFGVITLVQREYPKARIVAAIDSLNKQIEDFNATRDGNMGITPIDKRVSRVVHDPELDQVTTFDQEDKPFIVLKREPDGRFKGILEQPYHELAFSGPDGSHSWGNILAEFYLEKEMF
jgi:hypothetical protein